MTKYLLAGLGNPEDKYLKNRHNVGFLFIDFLQATYKLEGLKEEKKFKSLFNKYPFGSDQVLLAKPLTFMNLSGEAVSEIKRYYGLQAQNIYIVHDDLDIEFGKFKITNVKSPRGHNGLESIEKSIGNDFYRIRVGVENRSADLKAKFAGRNYVLSDFSSEEMERLNSEIFPRVLEELRFINLSQSSTTQ